MSAKFSNRVRFNWGYHDGQTDWFNGHPRLPISSGNQSLKTVSQNFDRAYYNGYRLGLEQAKTGTKIETSEAAWDKFAAEVLGPDTAEFWLSDDSDPHAKPKRRRQAIA